MFDASFVLKKPRTKKNFNRKKTKTKKTIDAPMRATVLKNEELPTQKTNESPPQVTVAAKYYPRKFL